MGPTDPHHDGSERYVEDQDPSLGDRVTVFVRVPRTSGTSAVHVRVTPDTEPRFAPAVLDHETPDERWYRATVRVHNPVTRYRFLLDGGPSGARWLNAAGVHDHDVTDTADFRLVADHGAPGWVPDAVLYQVFPDRFATSGRSRDLPPWFDAAAWDDPVARGRPAAMRQLYGGDLAGIEQHLDHLVDLGVTGVYLNPVFPAPENHRYCASSFDVVDPLLGGDEALASLARAAHARGLRLIGDLTVNHTGDTHAWFEAARRDPEAVERGFYHWTDYPDHYEAWAGVPTLPKLDHRDPELKRRLYEGGDAVVSRWLRPPFELDGWRVDAANVAGRCGPVDETLALAHGIRTAMAAVRPDAYLLAEHCHHAAPDLDQGGWHGTMDYVGFTVPVWSWLRDPAGVPPLLGLPFGPVRRPGTAIVRTYRETHAEHSWATRLASVNLLGSHDTARFATVTADPARTRVGVGLLLSLPGVPSILYGDEVGLTGADNEQARRTMPWDRQVWDAGLLDWYRRLIALRRGHRALRRGGVRFLDVTDDTLTFVRDTRDEQLLVHATRGPSRTTFELPDRSASAPVTLVDGGAELAARRDRTVLVATDGPAFGVWAL